MDAPFSRFWWLWLPLLIMAAQLVLEFTLDSRTLSILHSEGGPHETMQTLAVAAALVVAAITLLRFPYAQRPWLALWVALAALCCFYVTGEEISWGQHLFHWATPGFWSGINDQNETNLHNTSSWLDQKPRLLLELGVLTGGILMPLIRRFRPALLPARFAAIYPPDCLAVTALLALAVKITDTVAEALHVSIFERGSEVQELYLFYFVLLYLLALHNRIMKKKV